MPRETGEEVMSKQPYLYERLPEDDPNYELIKSVTLEGWADSHRFVADAHAGLLGIAEFVERSTDCFRRLAEIHVHLKDNVSVSAKCDEIDRLARKVIGKVSTALLQESRSLGKVVVRNAVVQFRLQINEHAARLKQRICEYELAASPFQASAEKPTFGRTIQGSHSLDLATPAARKAAKVGWKNRWTTSEHRCTNDDLTETAFHQKDRAWLNRWENGKLTLKDPGRSSRIQAIETVLRNNLPPKWHPAARLSRS